MSSNYIGLLQEYCQKSKVELPSYSTIEDNKLFQCQVKLFNGETFIGGFHTTKKSAMQESAQLAIEHLKNCSCVYKTNSLTKIPVNPTKVVIQKQTLVLIDLENYPQMNLNGLEYVNVKFIGFVGKCSALAQHQHTFQHKYNFMDIIIVDSVLSDAVDHFISMYIGINLTKYENMIIVSRDKFVGCSIDAVNQLAKNVKILHAATSR
jgi:hypothetical protein